MSNPYAFPRPKLIAVSIAAAFGGLSLNSLATPAMSYGPNITLNADYSLGGGAPVDGLTDPAASLSSTATGADFYLSKSDGSSEVFFHTYGDSGLTTYFGARASGSGIFSAYTVANYHGSFTNTSGAAAPFLFSFIVQSGEVGVSGTGDGTAELLLRLQADTGSGLTTVAQDHTQITQTSGMVTCLDNIDFGLATPYMTCSTPGSSSAFGSGGLYSVNLGIINPGQTFAINYDIVATVSGNGIDLTGSCSGGYGDNQDFQLTAFIGGGEGGCATVSAVARSGDPFGGAPDTNPGLFQATIPEPGSLALTGLALGGLAAARRRKRGKPG